MTDRMSIFAGAAIALYAAHHVGDYWVQTDAQALRKSAAGAAGRLACSAHVATYVTTQAVFLLALTLMTGAYPAGRIELALLVSGVTHWTADRREHGLLFWLARRIPGKQRFLMFDQGHLASGAWALDQSWHIFWGVFVAALIVAF